MTYPSGLSALTGYDSARRPVSIDLGSAGSFSQTYDRTGDVTSESRDLDITGSAGTGTQTFTYDGAGRLASSSLAGVTTTYGYDLDGNRTSRTTGGVTTTFDYDRTGVLADRSVGGGMAYTFTYDPYGNLTGEPDATGAVTTYSLDLADRLTAFDPPTTAATTYGYDALARIVTRVRPDGTDTYRFVGTSEQVAGFSVSGTGTAIASLVEPSGGRPLTKQGATTYAALPDVGGSTAAVAPVSGSVITGAVRFDPWGLKLDETTTGVGPFRYRGALELAPAGSDPLYESGARLYRPGLAAFTSLDSYAGSALEPASLNRYLYAQANPATLVDPSGHAACPGGRNAFDGVQCQGQSTADLNTDEGDPTPPWEAPDPVVVDPDDHGGDDWEHVPDPPAPIDPATDWARWFATGGLWVAERGMDALDSAKGARGYASWLGHCLAVAGCREAIGPAAVSTVARELPRVGAATSFARSVNFKGLAKWLPVVGAGVTLAANLVEGRDPGEALVRTVGSVIGGAIGTAAGGAACVGAAAASFGIGALGCGALVFGGAYGGAELGEWFVDSYIIDP